MSEILKEGSAEEPKKRGRKPKTEVVELDSSLIKSMQEQIDNLHKMLVAQSKPSSSEPIKPIESLGTMRFYKDDPIIHFGEARRVNGSDIVDLTVLHEDGTEEVIPEDYGTFYRSIPSWRLEILETVKNNVKNHQGGLPNLFVTRVADQLKNATSTGEPFVRRQIMLEHVTVEATSKVRFLEGPWKDEELTVNTKCINK